MRPLRPPGDWAGLQGEFRGATTRGFDGVARRPVRYRWWTVDSWTAGLRGRMLDPVWTAMLLRSVVRRRSAGTLWHAEGCHVAIYDADAEPGAAPLLVFEVQPDAFGRREGIGKGEVLGEFGPNGVLALSTLDDIVWPIANPRAPYPGTPDL